MITKFVIKRRNKEENYDVRKLVSSVKWTTDMNYSAGQLDFDLVEVSDGFGIRNGDIVMFDWDGNHIFKGYVFKYDLKKGDTYSVTAYDALRYFKSSDSMVFGVSNLSQRFDTICKYLKLPHSAIQESHHKLKGEVEDNKTYFNMLQSAIDQTYSATGSRFFLRDNFGKIELRKFPYKQLDTIIGDHSMVSDYTFSRSIEQTANVVKVRNSSPKNKMSVTESGDTTDKWGKLVYVKPTSSNLNKAQMKKLAKDTLREKNKQTNKLSITVIGDIDFQAGNSVIVNIQKMKNIGVGAKRFLIQKAVHTFGNNYSIDLTMEW